MDQCFYSIDIQKITFTNVLQGGKCIQPTGGPKANSGHRPES